MTITNTTKKLEAIAPALIVHNLATGELGGKGGFFETMEADGQREVVAQASRLPSAGLISGRMWGHRAPTQEDREKCGFNVDVDKGARAAFDAMGIKVLGADPDDPIWCRVELPQGWRLEATGHSMWSRLLDAKGCARASIFYKAAFYDRSCHIDPEHRFRVSYGPKDDPTTHRRQFAVYDASMPGGTDGTAIFETEVYASDTYETLNKAEEEARLWLVEHHPDYRNPAAYWENA
jgi:hypothetical protein